MIFENSYEILCFALSSKKDFWILQKIIFISKKFCFLRKFFRMNFKKINRR